MSDWSDQRLARLIAIREMVDRLEETNRQNFLEIAELRQRYKILEADYTASEIDKFERMWENIQNEGNDEPEAPNNQT
jgi:hypothetical protein